MSSLTDQLRETVADIAEVQNELSDLRAQLELRTDKPRSGQHPPKSYARAKREYDKKKAELVLELNELKAEQARLKRELGDTPLGAPTLGKVIARLIYIEQLIEEQGADAAWDSLSAYIDTLEEVTDG